jgi:hypothetical protein
MYLVQILLPLYADSGERLPKDRYAQVRRELTARYGGATAFLRSPAQGTWKDDDGKVERDEVVMCEVMVESLEREWWAQYRSTLEARFEQRELIIRALKMERI